MKFLLDNNCRISERERRKDENIKIDTLIEKMDEKVDDPQIREYARRENYIVVTKDKNFITECLKQNLPVALYYQGYAYHITAEPVELLNKEIRILGRIPE